LNVLPLFNFEQFMRSRSTHDKNKNCPIARNFRIFALYGSRMRIFRLFALVKIKWKN